MAKCKSINECDYVRDPSKCDELYCPRKDSKTGLLAGKRINGESAIMGDTGKLTADDFLPIDSGNCDEVMKIRLPSTIKDQLQKIAVQNCRTLAGQIRFALANWLRDINRKEIV